MFRASGNLADAYFTGVGLHSPAGRSAEGTPPTTTGEVGSNRALMVAAAFFPSVPTVNVLVPPCTPWKVTRNESLESPDDANAERTRSACLLER